MINFYKISQGWDFSGLMAALTSTPSLWNAVDVRTTTENTPHAQVDDILLRFNDLENPAQHECKNYPAWHTFPEAQNLVFWLMNHVRGTRLGRVIITRLPPGGMITPHIDAASDVGTDEDVSEGYYNRYHVVLNSNPGCVFRCGDECVNMLSGEIWYFDRHTEHEVINNSNDDRVNMIVDIRSER